MRNNVEASSEIAEPEREMESRRRYAAWIRDHKTASEAEIWQAAERRVSERLHLAELKLAEHGIAWEEGKGYVFRYVFNG